MGTKREPIKKSSIEKKNRIIKIGFEIMCNAGYHNVSCVDIAKAAGVSTGIIYQYFNDKRDIFIEGIKDYANMIMYPMFDLMTVEKVNVNDLRPTINAIIDSLINAHTISKEAHEELMAMMHLDKEVAAIFLNSEYEMNAKIADILAKSGFSTKNLEERVHIVVGIVENLCHDLVYNRHEGIDYKVEREKVIETVLFLLH